jgi:hypothetical protein
MAGLLANFRNTIIVSTILALILVGAYAAGPQGTGPAFWQGVFRWLHVFFGILWIGLLYYFNFVQIRKMPDIPAELKPAVSKYIAPEALFWFRWAAVATVVMGLAIAGVRGYSAETLSLGLAGGYDPTLDRQYTLLGHHLAEPEARAGHRGSRRRHQGQGRTDGHAGLAHEPAALDPDAGLDDHVADRLRLDCEQAFEKARPRGGPFSL